jgi:transcriptional regulator with XRE-family HTH domain
MRSDREIYLRSFSKNLRALRKAKGFTQERLAYEADLSYKYLQELERGKKSPSLITLIRLCKALAVSLNEISKGLIKMETDSEYDDLNE